MTLGGLVYHVFNRAVKGTVLFSSAADYEALKGILVEAKRQLPMRILAYCLMPNHWHLLLWPFNDGDLTRFVKWLTATHASRWNRAHNRLGRGAVYQSRYKSVPVQCDHHLFSVWRYVERNPVRANLVERAEDWAWSSRSRGACQEQILDNTFVPLPWDWLALVNLPQTESELAAFRKSMLIGAPFGAPGWLATNAPKKGRPARVLRKT